MISHYDSLFENNHAVMLLIDPADGTVFDANPAAVRYYGWTRAQLQQMKISGINTLSAEEVKAEMERARVFSKNRFSFKHRLSDGSVRDVEVYSGPISVDGHDLLYSLVHDVTERNVAEERILNLLKEKEILMSEIHHRLKNNINNVYGLLNLQAGRSGNGEVKRVLSDAARRLRSMSILYDKLSHTDYSGRMSAAGYFSSLANDIVSTFTGQQEITVAADVDDVLIDTRILFNLGIIVNELVSNSVKHAFVNMETGRISVTGGLRDGRFRLFIADNGPGLPSGFDVKNSTGLGLQLVQMLIHQMEGTLSVSSDSGTSYVVGVNVSE
jgi:PAS domain S-box-containing protein